MTPIKYIDGGPIWTDSPDRNFAAISWDHMRAFAHHAPKASRLWFTYVAIINLCQTTGSRTVEVWPKWFKRAGLDRKRFGKHVKTLEDVGLVQVERRVGKPLVITLSDLVPLRETKGKRHAKTNKN